MDGRGNGWFFSFPQLTNVWQPDNSQTFRRIKHRLIPGAHCADGRNDQVVQSSDSQNEDRKKEKKKEEKYRVTKKERKSPKILT